LRGHCRYRRRAFDASQDVQPIEAKEEIHLWEKHTGEFRVRVKRSMPDRVMCASSAPRLKKCLSAGIAACSCVRLHPARIIAITAHIAFTRAMSMTGDRGIA
jgi:hypothetical protein